MSVNPRSDVMALSKKHCVGKIDQTSVGQMPVRQNVCRPIGFRTNSCRTVWRSCPALHNVSVIKPGKNVLKFCSTKLRCYWWNHSISHRKPAASGDNHLKKCFITWTPESYLEWSTWKLLHLKDSGLLRTFKSFITLGPSHLGFCRVYRFADFMVCLY